MKIAYINKTRWLSKMPSTVFSFFNSFGFAENGHKSELIFKDKNISSEMNYDEFFGIKENKNFKLITFSDKNILKSNKFFYSRVMKYVSSQNFDIVISRDPAFLPYLAKIKENEKKVKCFYQSHNFYLDLSFQPNQTKVNQKKYYEYETKYLNKLNGILALNNPHKELYEKYVDVPVFCAYPGLKKVNEKLDNFSKKTIIYSGSFQLKKGLKILIESFSKLDSSYKLILAGGRNESEIKLVEDQLNKYNIGDRVEITGWITYSELEKKLMESSVGIIPLKDDFYNRYLTAPSKLFDYLSFGLPIVYSDLPANCDIIGNYDCGISVKAEDTSQLTDAINTIFKNQESYNKYSNNSLALAKDSLWKKRCKEMLDFMLKS